jgi:hypothetical protein
LSLGITIFFIWTLALIPSISIAKKLMDTLQRIQIN